MTDQRDPSIESALAALDAIGQAATGYGRADLAARLHDKATSLGDPSFHVLVVGEFKQGKSSLLNALVARTVCPVDDDIATAVPTIVRWAADPTAEVVFQPRESGGNEAAVPARETISVDDVGRCTPSKHGGADRTVHSVEIGVPSRLLERWTRAG